MAGTLGEESNRIHQDSDVDNSVVALHHTLGKSATQSAAGNHNHDSDYAERTHSHDDLSGSGHEHALNTLSDVTLNSPGTDQFLGYGADGNWTNESIPKEAHSQIATTPPVPRGLGDLWVDTSADLLSWDDAWTYPILVNGWIVLNTDHPVRYRKFPGGLINAAGLVYNNATRSNYDVIFTFPPEYRPIKAHIYAAVRNEIPDMSLTVDPDGTLKILRPYTTASQWISIAVTFSAV